MVEIPWGAWGEAHSRRRHQGRQGAVLLAELIRRRPGGNAGVSWLSMPFLAHPQAAILQQTAEYIFSLEQEKTRLLQQNTQLKRFIQVLPQGWDRREWDNPGWPGWGCHLQFLGLRVGPSTLLSQRLEMFPFLWQGRNSTWHLLPGRGRRVGVPFSIISTNLGCQGWPGGSSGAGVPWLNCPGCYSVRIRLAQGCVDRQEPICPPASNTTPGRSFLHGAVVGSGTTWMAGRASVLAPFP